jgi:phage tail-like protein
MPETGKPIEIHASFRFTVKIGNENLAAFSECTLPNVEVETFEVKEGGLNDYTHKLPVRVKTGTVTLRYGVTADDRLLKWYIRLMEGLDGDDKKFTELSRPVTVVMYNSQFNDVATWNFDRAYPVKWKGPTLKTEQGVLAIEELELAYHGFSIESQRR